MGPTPSWGRGYGARWRGYARWRRGSGGKRPLPVVASVVAVASIVVVAVAAGATHVLTARDAAATTVNMNCTLIVPPNPLTAQGLATPYQLTATNPADGPCNEANINQTAFVQGAVINPATGQISVYDPLVIDQGSTPAAAPVVPQLPANATVALWFGFNGNTLSLVGADQVPGYQVPTASLPAPSSPAAGPAAVSAAPLPTMAGSQFAPAIASMPTTATTATASPSAAVSLTPNSGLTSLFPASAPTPVNPGDFAAASGTPDPILQQANCIAGENIDGQFSSFTQVAACNAVAFFQTANNAVNTGKLQVPAPGTGVDGLPCLTTRNFALIDQDQSDNVTTQYLAAGDGQIAQDTAANRQRLVDAGTLDNGSDNGLLDLFVDPALGCSPWKAPNLADSGTSAPALPLDELQAATYAGLSTGSGPAALVPLNDPMTLDNNGQFNVDKTNTYRSIVDMLPLPTGETPSQYCQDMEQIQGTRLQQDVNLLINKKSPAPLMADNLFTFMAMRLQQSFINLKCANFGMQNDVSTIANGAGVVVAACFLYQAAPVTAGAGNPLAGVPVCPVTTAGGSPAPVGSPASGGSPAPAGPPAPNGSESGSGAPAPSSPAANSVPVWWQRDEHHHWWY
jgi:hypothetical protein